MPTRGSLVAAVLFGRRMAVHLGERLAGRAFRLARGRGRARMWRRRRRWRRLSRRWFRASGRRDSSACFPRNARATSAALGTSAGHASASASLRQLRYPNIFCTASLSGRRLRALTSVPDCSTSGVSARRVQEYARIFRTSHNSDGRAFHFVGSIG